MDFYEEISKELRSGSIRDRERLNQVKKELCKKHGLTEVPTNTEILKKTGVQKNLLLKKPSRSMSGVSVVAIMTHPQECPGDCIYCPCGEAAQSYTGKEPAALRAGMSGFDPFRQTEERVEQLAAIGHPTSKIELIIMGGTFTAMPPQYQESFVLDAFRALNGNDSPTLQEAQRLNEKAAHRCVGMTFEIRPDYCEQNHINDMLRFGATRVELGVQTIYNDVYEKIRRGHTVEDVIAATQLLKDSFLKTNYHLMPGLPFSSKDRDLAMFKQVFSDKRFKPDMLKIYPCLLAKKEFYANTKAHELYKSGKWTPLGNQEAAELISEATRFFPKWVRIMRIQRDIPKPYIEAGVTAGNLRELVHEKNKKKGIKCNCIRCREIRDKKPKEAKLMRQDYDASGGKEIFLSFEDTKQDLLLGLLRLRVPGKPFRKEIGPRTLGIRELHVYGPETDIGKNGKAQQHQGLGKQLIQEAEKIAVDDFDAREMLVMSGVGAREYYRKFGYGLEGCYMGKRL